MRSVGRCRHYRGNAACSASEQSRTHDWALASSTVLAAPDPTLLEFAYHTSLAVLHLEWDVHRFPTYCSQSCLKQSLLELVVVLLHAKVQVVSGAHDER